MSAAQQLLERGQAHLSRGAYAAARADFDRAWRSGEHSPEVHRLLIRCLVGEQKLGIAEEEAHRLLEQHPEMLSLHVTLAQIAFLSEQYPRAIEYASTAIACRTRLADACFIRAYAHARVDNLEAARNDIRHSIAAPRGASDFLAESPHLLHGAILEKLARHEDALLAYERALRVNARSTAALLGQWTCYQQLRMIPAAYLVAVELQETSPNAIETWQACAVSYRQYEDYDVASEYASRWSRAAMTDPRPCVEQARSLVALRRWLPAQESLEEALVRNEHDLPALAEMSRLLLSCPDDRLRDASRARQLARQACELTEWTSPPLMATLAAAHVALGETAHAADLMERCLALIPPEDDQHSLYAGLRRQYADGGTWRVAEEAEPNGARYQ